MEPKSPRSATAATAAAMKAVAAGTPTESPSKLTKPVADTMGFKTASWTAIPSLARTVGASPPSPISPPPKQRPNTSAPPRVEPPRMTATAGQVEQDLSEIKAMLATLTESVRDLQASLQR